MFGLTIIKTKDAHELRDNLQQLDRALDHVGVHPAEEDKMREFPGGFVRRITTTAVNVLLRQAEEVDAYRDMVDGPSVEHMRHELIVAQRNLAYERQARSADRIAYADALRAAGREKGVLQSERNRLNAELFAIADVLAQRGLVSPEWIAAFDGPHDGTWIDVLAEVVRALDILERRAEGPAEEPEQPELPLEERNELDEVARSFERFFGLPEGSVVAVDALPPAELDGCATAKDVAELTLREQAQLAIAAVCAKDGSFNARDAFDAYSAMPSGKLDEPGWFWDCEGLRDLGYEHVIGTPTTWRKRSDA